MSFLNGTQVVVGLGNNTNNATDDTYDMYDDDDVDVHALHVERVIVPLLFGVIFVVGLVGNGTLIYTVARNKSMRNVPNIYIVSLSLGDLFLILVSVPFSATIYTWYDWPYGEAICKFNHYMQTLSLAVSVFTLTALSRDRYIAIVDPMSKHMGKPMRRTIVIAVGIWIVAIVLAVPDMVSPRLAIIFENATVGEEEYYCQIFPDEWPEWYARYSTVVKFVLFFALPLLIITRYYLSMAHMLILSGKAIPCEAQGKKIQQKQVEARKKVAKVVLSFVVIFGICWLPRHIYLMWYHYDDEMYTLFWHIFKIFGFCMSFLNSCVNPIALYFLSNQFHKYYNRYLFCCFNRVRYASVENSTAMQNFTSTVRRPSTTFMTGTQANTAC